ncbi:hypothetical protein [Nocardioides convexus]|uniref:hypothetical protein n=1 Tax=Nocardioides convexus TaxID=2712224 RepID=UPI00241820CA|nr:hypothetical protein [Nocardioides convexus]
MVTPAVPDWVRGKFDKRITRASGIAKTGEPVETDVSDKPTALQQRYQPEGDEAKAALLYATRRRAEAVYVMDRNIARLVAEPAALGGVGQHRLRLHLRQRDDHR